MIKMIFYELYTLPNATEGIDTITVEVMEAVPSFIPLFLLFVFLVVFLGGIARQKSRTGTADYPMWSVVASLSTFIISLILTLVSGLIRLEWLVIITVILIFSGVWLFLDSRGSEV
jgi:hypothetical protein